MIAGLEEYEHRMKVRYAVWGEFTVNGCLTIQPQEEFSEFFAYLEPPYSVQVTKGYRAILLDDEGNEAGLWGPLARDDESAKDLAIVRLGETMRYHQRKQEENAQ